MEKGKELTERQRRFAEEYVRCGDGAEAALAAGYSPATAERQAARLLSDPAVQAYRRQTEQRLFEAVGVSSAWIGRRLVEIVDRCMQAVPHMSRNPDTKRREPDGVWEFDAPNAIRALHELAGYMHALEAEDGESGGSAFEDWLSGQEGEGRL